MSTPDKQAARKAALAEATIKALRVLRPGDRLRVTRCAGLIRTYRWTGQVEHGFWLVCHPRLRDHFWSWWHFRDAALPVNDVAVSHIIAVNGRRACFFEETPS